MQLLLAYNEVARGMKSVVQIKDETICNKYILTQDVYKEVKNVVNFHSEFKYFQSS